MPSRCRQRIAPLIMRGSKKTMRMKDSKFCLASSTRSNSRKQSQTSKRITWKKFLRCLMSSFILLIGATRRLKWIVLALRNLLSRSSMLKSYTGTSTEFSTQTIGASDCTDRTTCSKNLPNTPRSRSCLNKTTCNRIAWSRSQRLWKNRRFFHPIKKTWSKYWRLTA